jgi:hypothetical protein
MDILYVTSLVLALFSVGLSCGFYVAANRAGRDSQTHLQQFLGDMRAELRNRFSDIQHDISKNQSPMLANLGEQLRQVEANPGNEESKFAAFATVLKEPTLQLIILMHEKKVVLNKQLDYSIMLGQPPWGYELLTPEGGRMGGSGGFSPICDEIGDTGLLTQDMRDRVTLTDMGHRFAAWLTRNGKKAPYFNSTLGGWGDRPDGLAQPNSPLGYPGWPFGPRVTPESQDVPPSAGGPPGETVFPPNLHPDFFGMRPARGAQQQPQAATPSPDAANNTEATQTHEPPPAAPNVQAAQAAQPPSSAAGPGGNG